MAVTFVGPPRRILLVRNTDQATRYLFTDPTQFIAEVRAAWRGRLDIAVLDERADLMAELPARLADSDCLVLLSGAVHQPATCRALQALRAPIGRWISSGKALIALHPGETDTPGWLPDGIEAEYVAADRHRADPDPVFADHPVISMPYGRSAALICQQVQPYRHSYFWLTGPFATAGAVVARSPDGPVLLAGELSRGRVVLSPLLLDWHCYARLFVNALVWTTHTRVLDVAGEAAALAALTGPGRLAAGVRLATPDDRDGGGLVIDRTAPGRPRIRLEGNGRLQITPPDLAGWLPDLLRARLDRGRWDASPNQTIEICRYLAEAGALTGFREQLDYIDSVRDGADPAVGDTLVALAHGIVLCRYLTNEHHHPLRKRFECTVRRFAAELDHTSDAALIPEIPLLVDAARRAGDPVLLAQVLHRASRALRTEVAAAVVPPNPVFRLRLYAAARALDHHGALPDDLPGSGLTPPDLAALVAGDPPPPTVVILDLLENTQAGPANRSELTLPATTHLGLLLFAYAEVDRLAELPSSLAARQLAFWERRPAIARLAAGLLAAAHNVDVFGGGPGERSRPDVAPRLRLAEAFSLLGVPPAERRLDRPVAETMAAVPLRHPLLAAATTLVRTPLHRMRKALTPSAAAIGSAGGVGVIPLVSSGVLRVLVVMPGTVRVALWAVCAVMGTLLALSASATARVVTGIAAALLAWCYGVCFLTVSVFGDEVRRWGERGPALVDGDLLARAYHLTPVAVTNAALLFVLAMWLLRRQNPAR